MNNRRFSPGTFGAKRRLSDFCHGADTFLPQFAARIAPVKEIAADARREIRAPLRQVKRENTMKHGKKILALAAAAAITLSGCGTAASGSSSAAGSASAAASSAPASASASSSAAAASSLKLDSSKWSYDSDEPGLLADRRRLLRLAGGHRL
jgi:uncharacterized protein YceK